jgi:hypothetical protein
MPMTNAERQRRFRKRRARREKVAAGKVDHRDAEILRLKHEIIKLRRGERWCSGFDNWPTPIAHDAKGHSGFRGQPFRFDLPNVASWVDYLVVDQPEPTLGGPWANHEWVLCRDGWLRPIEPGTSPLIWKGNPKHPDQSWWCLIARRVPLVPSRRRRYVTEG